jgi:hypothetical protein
MGKFFLSFLLSLSTLNAQTYNAGDIVFTTTQSPNNNRFQYGLKIFNQSAGYTYRWTKPLGPGQQQVFHAAGMKTRTLETMGKYAIVGDIYGSNFDATDKRGKKFKTIPPLKYDADKYYYLISCTPAEQAQESKCVVTQKKANQKPSLNPTQSFTRPIPGKSEMKPKTQENSSRVEPNTKASPEVVGNKKK